MFDGLLNVPDCTRQPDLAYFRHKFEQYLDANPDKLRVSAACPRAVWEAHLTLRATRDRRPARLCAAAPRWMWVQVSVTFSSPVIPHSARLAACMRALSR